MPEDSMSDATRAAVVKRGTERDHRDLFGGRSAELGSAGQTLRPPPPPETSPVLGRAARNESSVLFTVDTLRGSAPAAAAEPQLDRLSTTVLIGDDEGVIDLRALASSPPPAGPRSVAPLFSETPPGAFSADIEGGLFGTVGAGTPAPARGFRLGKGALAGIAAAAVALVLGSVGLAVAFRGEQPVNRTAAVAVVPPASAAAPVAAPVPVPEPAASATASASPSDGDETAKAKPKKARAGAKVSGAASPKASKSEALASKPAPKAADKCGCKGNFDCIIRCTAKGH
jgi:hypothetical protein